MSLILIDTMTQRSFIQNCMSRIQGHRQEGGGGGWGGCSPPTKKKEKREREGRERERKRNQKKQEFTNSRPGPAYQLWVAKCCIGDLRGRRDVVYCWRNDVERRMWCKFKRKRRRKLWLRPTSLVFHCTSLVVELATQTSVFFLTKCISHSHVLTYICQ